MELSNAKCEVAFRHTAGKVKKLFTVNDCTGDTPGVDRIGPTDRVGTLALPVAAPDGDEFHVFAIAAARGGNATSSVEYWVAIVRSDAVWAMTSPFESELTTAKLVTAKPTALVLEQSPTTTDPGARYTATFGRLEDKTLPMLSSTILSKTTTVFEGDLMGGYPFNNLRPTIKVGTNETIIDDDGPCKLPAPGEEGGRVRLTAQVTKRSDGRTRVTCVAIAPK